MLFIIGMIFIVIAFLLSLYFLLNFREDDLNRPSFFNSRIREAILLSAIIVIFFVGEYLLFSIGFYYWMLIIPVACWLVYRYARSEWNRDVIITKLFQYYKVFSMPGHGYIKKEEQLTVPIEFALALTRVDREFKQLAKKYLEQRVKEGKLKKIKDMPQETWNILLCADKKEITASQTNLLNRARIDYIYEEVIEGKEYHDLRRWISDIIFKANIQLEKTTMNFSFVKQTRPDFTKEDVQLVEAETTVSDKGTLQKPTLVAEFPERIPLLAKKFGWVTDFDEYHKLAALEFSRRYPKHIFSKETRKKYKYTNKQIFNYAQNWDKLDK